MEPKDYSLLDHEIRQILIRQRIHFQPACKERLYLPRKELGRGLHCLEHRSEAMLLNLYLKLKSEEGLGTRRDAVLKVERDKKSHLALILPYLAEKYASADINPKELASLQNKILYSEIQKKDIHSMLYKSRNNELAHIGDSAAWLTHGNNRADREAALCYLQDRNLFGGDRGVCPHCKERMRSVDHLASQCEKLVHIEYTRRHNEIVRVLHGFLCTKYGLRRSKRMKGYVVEPIVSNANVEIRFDTRVHTDTRIAANRPDIQVWDKKRRQILFIEVGVTNQDRLQLVETEKYRKYDVLANETSLIHKCPVKIVPYVITWDGIVTRHHRRHTTELGLPNNIEAYIHSLVLHKTLECVTFDRRRDADGTGGIVEEADRAVQRLEMLVREGSEQKVLA